MRATVQGCERASVRLERVADGAAAAVPAAAALGAAQAGVCVCGMRRSAAAAVSRSWREWWRGGRAAAGGEAAGAGSERAGGGRRPQPPQPPQGPQPAVLLPTSQPPSRPPRRRSSTARREGALRSSRIARARGRALGAARSEAHVSELLSQWRVEHGYALLGLLKGVAGGLATVPALRRMLLWGLNQRLVESHHFDVFFETLDREAAYDQSTLHELLRTVLYMQSQGIALSETAYGVLVRVYAFQGRLREAEETLVRMRAEGFAARETVLLNAMLEGYLRTGEHQRLREFLVDESVRGKVSLNVASINALVGSLVAVGDTAAAAVVVDALRRRECPMGAALKGTNGSNDSSGGDEAATRATYGIDGVPRPDSLTFELLIDGHARALEPAGAVRALNALLAEGLELTKGVADGIVRAHALAGEDDVVRLFIGNLVRTSLAPPLWPDEDTYGPVLREKVRVHARRRAFNAGRKASLPASSCL